MIKNIFKKIKSIFFRLFRKKYNFKSKGERLIDSWLNMSGVRYIPQYKVTLDKIARNSNVVYIDFLVKYNRKKYAIEYNGRQHYCFVPFFHKTPDDFEKQLHRDVVVKQWCLDNNIEFIEIPYTMSCTQICDKLKEIIK